MKSPPDPPPAADVPRGPRAFDAPEGLEPSASPLPMLLGRILARRWLVERRAADAGGSDGAASEASDRARPAPP